MPRPPQIPIRNPQAFSKAVAEKSQTEVAALFMRAIALHQQGQLALAKLMYEQVLSKQPNHFNALHLSGVIAAQSKNLTLAVELIGKAIEINSMNAEAWYNRGNAFQELKRVEEAVASYDGAIAIKPDYAEAYYNRGNALQALKRVEEAIASYDRAIEIKPDFVEAHSNRGGALQALKRAGEAVSSYDRAIEIKPDYAEAYYNRGNALQALELVGEAIASYDRAIEIKPDYVEAHCNRGGALEALKRVGEAIASYDRAIEIKPDYAEAHSNRGIAFQALERVGEAIASYDRAIEIKPDFAEAYYNRGTALQALKRVGEAVASYERAIEIKSEYAEAYYNRGNAFQELKRMEEAVASYERAIEIKPDYAEAHSNRGNSLQALKRSGEAIASYDKAIEINPEFVEAYYNRCILRLVLRDFKKGFVDFKYRWDTKHLSTKPQKTTIPSSTKSSLKGRLLIWAEQGLGDEIFYAGLLPLLFKEDVSISLSADKRLHPIYRRSFPKIDLLDKDILMNSSVDTGFDVQVPIGDLGLLLDVDEAKIQATRSPYLMSDPVKRDNYHSTISAYGSGLICGLAWKSVNPKFGIDKSIDLDSFGPLLGLPGVHFINLQYGEVKEEIQQIKSSLLVDIHQVPDIDVFNDIEGLLALIDACDVIVTTSNVTAHLAGSIGKRAAVLVPYSSGKIWYWHHNDERSFWYPSLKLFYQDNPLTWDKAIGDCANWVKGLR